MTEPNWTALRHQLLREADKGVLVWWLNEWDGYGVRYGRRQSLSNPLTGPEKRAFPWLNGRKLLWREFSESDHFGMLSLTDRGRELLAYWDAKHQVKSESPKEDES